jgi:hypothetical protein
VQLETLREVMADEYAKDGFASAAP